MSLPGGQHGEVALEIGRLIGNHVEAAHLGNTYAAGTRCILERDPDTVRAADVAVMRRERLAEITNPEKHIPFAPDLAVEVLSPDDRDDEVEEKVQLWLSAGSQIVWVVDPDARIVVVYRPGAEPVTLREDEEIDACEVLPGFRCRVSDFFP
jgi:Uma2 family endonuclease